MSEDASRAEVTGMRERALAWVPARFRGALRDVLAPVFAAVALVVAVTLANALLARHSLGFIVAQLVIVLVVSVIAFLAGRYIGNTVWPRHGGTVARKLLESYAKNPDRGELVMTGRPEFRSGASRRIFEADALIAGVMVLYVFVVVPFAPLLGTLLVGPLPFILALYVTILLVPHWSFARLGLRRVDRARFVVRPLTSDYSERLKISNGAIVLLALGIGGFVLRQQGQTDFEAAISILSSVISIVLVTLVAAATAVAFYQRREPIVLENLARDAVALGYHDARGENETEILRNLRPRR